MNVHELARLGQKKLTKVGINSAQLDSEILLSWSLSKTREWLIAHSLDELTQSQANLFNSLIARRLEHQPICYITNRIEFYGLDFYVDNRVLCPRAETELIVEQAIKRAPLNSSLIDLGTGSGAIAIAIAYHRKDLTITATEIASKALVVAKRNAEYILGKNNNIKFIKSNIWDDINGKFDTIVTNLPYVSTSYTPNMEPEVKKEPAIAIFGGGKDGLSLYRKFYDGMPSHTNPKTIVFHESDPWQHDKLKKLANQASLSLLFEDYLILGFLKK